MINKLTILTFLLGLIIVAVLPGPAVAANIVLVHGLNMDGGAWRSVYKQLTADGHSVSIAQLPMTSVQDDIAATRRVITAQDGPVVLVGHSYGGMVISHVGTQSQVKALVYIAAFQPKVGESLAYLNASIPAELPQDAIRMFDDGYYVVAPDAWVTYVANGLSDADAQYTAKFQTAGNTSIFGFEAEAAAWQGLPSWAVIATKDRTISPELQRRMAIRSGAKQVDIDAGHLLQISHPDQVIAVIKEAAAAVN